MFDGDVLLPFYFVIIILYVHCHCSFSREDSFLSIFSYYLIYQGLFVRAGKIYLGHILKFWRQENIRDFGLQNVRFYPYLPEKSATVLALPPIAPIIRRNINKQYKISNKLAMPFDLRVDKIETQHCAWLNKQTNKATHR